MLSVSSIIVIHITVTSKFHIVLSSSAYIDDLAKFEAFSLLPKCLILVPLTQIKGLGLMRVYADNNDTFIEVRLIQPGFAFWNQAKFTRVSG